MTAALLLQGCAGVIRPAQDWPQPYRPTVDLKATGQAPEQLEQDTRECNAFAVEVDGAKAAVNGAVFGAVLGTLLGAAVGLRGHNLASVAAFGAVSGAGHEARYAAYANLSQYQIVQRCLTGRGYSVIN